MNRGLTQVPTRALWWLLLGGQAGGESENWRPGTRATVMGWTWGRQGEGRSV